MAPPRTLTGRRVIKLQFWFFISTLSKTDRTIMQARLRLHLDQQLTLLR